jgi:hypothetical protein
MVAVPRATDVDWTVHVVGVDAVALLRNWQLVVGPAVCEGSSSWNAAVAEAPACVTVNVCPAMVTVPVLGGPELSGIAMNRPPLPVPLAPLGNVMNGEVVLAVHAQPFPVVTVMVAVALVLLMFSVVGEIV